MAIESSTQGEINLAREAEFTLGPIKVRPPTLEAIIGERREIIEPRIMQVLVALVRRRGEVVSRDDLIQLCWEGRAVGDDAINRCIARLRRLAEAEGGFAIETIPRVGYRLTVSQAPVAGVPPRLSWWRRYRVAIMSAILLIAVGAAAFIARDFQTEQPSGTRVAVLPFEPLSSEKDVGYFGKALAEQITGVLNDNQVQPVSNVKSAALRKPDRDRAARNLGVDFILDGTVQRTQAGLHVSAHIDHTTTHATLWTASFDQNGEDPVELQSQIAAKVVDQIKAALRAAGAGSDEAISAYLKAQENARIGGRAATNLRLSLMRTVVAKAPDFSQGFSGLGLSAAQLAQFAAPPPEVAALRSEARKAISRALDLDAKNSEAYLAQAVLTENWGEREALFRKGLAINPEEPTLNSTLAFLLADEGRMSEALLLQQRAALFDPLSPRKTAGWATSLAAMGNVAQAHDTIERAAKLWPRNAGVWSARLYVLGLYGYEQEALALVGSAPPDRESEFLAALRAFLQAIVNKTPTARAEARRTILIAEASHRLDAGGSIELLARLGETDAAFDVAERGYFSGGSPDKYTRPTTANLFAPASAPLRRDPRFLPLATRLGLMAFWKTHIGPDFCATEDVPVCRELKRGAAPSAPAR